MCVLVEIMLSDRSRFINTQFSQALLRRVNIRRVNQNVNILRVALPSMTYLEVIRFREHQDLVQKDQKPMFVFVENVFGGEDQFS